jgi:hypothetical protein
VGGPVTVAAAATRGLAWATAAPVALAVTAGKAPTGPAVLTVCRDPTAATVTARRAAPVAPAVRLVTVGPAGMPDNTATAGPAGRPGPPGKAATVVSAALAPQGGEACWNSVATVGAAVTVRPAVPRGLAASAGWAAP